MTNRNLKSKCAHCPAFTDPRLFCAQLGDDELTALSNESKTLEMRRGGSLEGQHLDRWPIVSIVSGVLSMQHLLRDGRKTISAFFMRGDIIDMRNFSNRNSGALIALGKVNLCRLAPSVFEQIMAKNSNAQEVIWENLRDQAFRAMDHSSDIAKKQALEKLASFIFECLHRQEIFGKTGIVEIPVRRIDLAEYLGMQPETVSRCFKDLQKRGIIETLSLTSLRIKDPDLLRQIANGDKEGPLGAPREYSPKILKSA